MVYNLNMDRKAYNSSVEQSHSWETNSLSAREGDPRI
jgi:hypothetical protein